MHSVGWRWTTLPNWFPFSSISIGAKRLISTLHSSTKVYLQTRPCAMHSIYHKTTSAYTKKNGLHRQTYYYLSSGSTTKLISDFIAIYVLYYVYIFVHAAKIKWTFVLPIACVYSSRHRMEITTISYIIFRPPGIKWIDGFIYNLFLYILARVYVRTYVHTYLRT